MAAKGPNKQEKDITENDSCDTYPIYGQENDTWLKAWLPLIPGQLPRVDRAARCCLHKHKNNDQHADHCQGLLQRLNRVYRIASQKNKYG